MKQKAEFVIGGTKSGSGKTLLTLGILAALARRGLPVQPFKCGPDFIDPTLHQMMVPRPSINLDLHMMGTAGCQEAYFRHSSGADVVVVEGVMGLFDGGKASTAALAITLDMPVVLIIDVRSAAESVAAVIKGFEVYNPDVRICGVICNLVGSKRHEQLIRDAVSQSCTTEILGFFPRNISFEIPSRHLGLYMGEEVALGPEQVEQLVVAIESHLDIDRLLQLSRAPRKIHTQSIDQLSVQPAKLRLAVARDEAFCFYYQDNFELFKKHGFELVYFSPLKDESLPVGIDAVYLGGGYPELFAEQLSANIRMRQALWQWAQDGKMLYAECGGFMYLTNKLVAESGKSYPMANVFPATVRMKPRFSRLGYRTVTLHQDCFLGPAGKNLYGHEFHYSEIEAIFDTVEQIYVLEDGRKEGYRVHNAIGSYIHLHFAKTQESIMYLHTMLQQSKKKREDNG